MSPQEETRMEVLVVCFTCGAETVTNERPAGDFFTKEVCPKCGSGKIKTMLQHSTVQEEVPEDTEYYVGDFFTKAAEDLPITLKTEPEGLPLLKVLEGVFKSIARIRRRAWEDKNIHVSMHSNQLSLRKPDGWHPWIISSDDVEAEDWEVWKGFVPKVEA